MFKSRIVGTVLLMIVLILSAGCRSDSESGPKVESEGEGKVIAKIGDDVLTFQRFKEFYENLPPEYLYRYQGESGQRTILGQLVELKMYAQLAKQIGLDKEPQIQKRIEEAVEKILATAYHLREVNEKVTVTEQEIKDYYELHKKEHIRPEQIKVREIIVTTKEEADEISALLRNGTDFQVLANQRSVDREHGDVGGSLGWQERGEGVLVKTVEDVAFSLKKGEISDPVKTKYGYHIVTVEDRKETFQRPLEEAHQAINNKIRNIKRRELMAQVKSQAEKEIKPEIKWDLLKEIPIREAQQPFMLPGMGGKPEFPAQPPVSQK